LEYRLVLPSPFALTIGEAIDLPAEVSGVTTGVTFNAAATAVMPGLSVQSDGSVSGTPSGTEGQNYHIAVEAVRGGEIVGTFSADKILRAALAFEYGPDDISISTSESFPTAGISAAVTGGNAANLTWTLENAPAWLEIQPGEEGTAFLKVVDGQAPEATEETSVTIRVSDDEGRTDQFAFNVSVISNGDKLVASDGTASDNLGEIVAMSADGAVAVAGSPYRDTGFGADAGAAYVFRKEGGKWAQVQTLLPQFGQTYGSFGYALAISDDGSTIAVCSSRESEGGTNSGAVYVFRTSGSAYAQSARILPDAQNLNYRLCESVAMSANGNIIAVGSTARPNGGEIGVYSALGGKIATFSRDGTLDILGKNVDVSDDGRLIVAGSQNTPFDMSAGIVYAFRDTGAGWTKERFAINVPSDIFGVYSVSVSGDGNTVLAGVHNIDWSGSAYVLANNGSNLAQSGKIDNPESAPYDYFGSNVAVSNNGSVALVAAKGMGTPGAAYAYSLPSGSFIAKMQAPDTTEANGFAASIALSSNGSTALIGAPYDNEKAASAGAAYSLPVM